MNFLDKQIEQQLMDFGSGANAKINKRAIYYSLLKTFPQG